ncbi:extracellular solute-binding protein [Agromyces sp. H66]|uniref:ABC transporter substrate-binding protein n=1 Tax=Agromyces sp. H66 TaxID=2529859 RepID=UPI00145A7BC3|nr:extracellular solute-binding protein [Agromyces sp. H66]
MSHRTLIRLAAVATAATLAASLAACASGDAAAGDDPGSLGGTLTLATSSEAGISPLLPDFESDTGVEVETTFAEAGALGEQLTIQLNAGTAPDLFRSAPGRAAPSAVLNLVDAGKLLDLSGQPWAEHVPSAFAPLQEADGKLYAYPTFGQAILAFYNVAAFDKAGVEPPTTWSELIDVLDALKAAGVTPLSFGFADNYVTQFPTYALASSLVNGLEPDFYDELASGETSFAESDGWRETFEKLFSLIDDGYTNADPLGTPGDPAMQAVGTGEAAIVIMPSGAAPTLVGFVPDGWDGLGVFALPATDDPSETFIPFSPDYLVVNADAKNRDAALAFLEHISDPDRASELAEAQGAIPALKNATPIDNPVNESIRSYLQEEHTSPFQNHIWPGGQLAAAMMAGIQQVIQGEKDVDGLLADMDAAYAEITG